MPYCSRGCGRPVATEGQTCVFCTVNLREGRHGGHIAPPMKVHVPTAPQAQPVPTFVPPQLHHVVVPQAPVVQVLAPGTLPAGANLVVSCKRSDQFAWTGINPANLLYVLKTQPSSLKLKPATLPPICLRR
jgi:hypothetical protein